MVNRGYRMKFAKNGSTFPNQIMPVTIIVIDKFKLLLKESFRKIP